MIYSVFQLMHKGKPLDQHAAFIRMTGELLYARRGRRQECMLIGADGLELIWPLVDVRALITPKSLVIDGFEEILLTGRTFRYPQRWICKDPLTEVKHVAVGGGYTSPPVPRQAQSRKVPLRKKDPPA